jgi:hypothetical protein
VSPARVPTVFIDRRILRWVKASRPSRPFPQPRRCASSAPGAAPAALLDALGLFWHLANFVAPALGLGALSAALCKLFWRRSLAGASWLTLAWQSALAGAIVLVAGLAATGHDGRMGTYAALVVACALVPWWHTVRR